MLMMSALADAHADVPGAYAGADAGADAGASDNAGIGRRMGHSWCRWVSAATVADNGVAWMET